MHQDAAGVVELLVVDVHRRVLAEPGEPLADPETGERSASLQGSGQLQGGEIRCAAVDGPLDVEVSKELPERSTDMRAPANAFARREAREAAVVRGEHLVEGHEFVLRGEDVDDVAGLQRMSQREPEEGTRLA